jgi:hypothetical protein
MPPWKITTYTRSAKITCKRMTQTLAHNPIFRALQENEHHLAADMPYILYKNKTNFIKTLRIATHSTKE